MNLQVEIRYFLVSLWREVQAFTSNWSPFWAFVAAGILIGSATLGGSLGLVVEVLNGSVALSGN